MVSGDFILSRDEGNDPQARARARERFVIGVNRRFSLTGARVGGRGPLRLVVASTERAALQEYVDRHASAQMLGRVVVHAKRQGY